MTLWNLLNAAANALASNNLIDAEEFLSLAHDAMFDDPHSEEYAWPRYCELDDELCARIRGNA